MDTITRECEEILGMVRATTTTTIPNKIIGQCAVWNCGNTAKQNKGRCSTCFWVGRSGSKRNPETIFLCMKCKNEKKIPERIANLLTDEMREIAICGRC